MAGSTRIRGRQLALKLGTTPVTDYWADTTSVTLENEEADSDVVTFHDAAEPGGAMAEFLNISGVQSTDADSLWTYLWDNPGIEVPFTYAPHGNPVATAAQPHFLGTCTTGPRPVLGGEAGRDTTYVFETRWDVVGKVTKDTGA